MLVPCILITQHKTAFYEWAVGYDQEKLDGELGETNIEGCLVSALGALPADDRLVEIRYRGMHMGTFDINRVADRPGEIAAIIAETYAVLTF